MLIFVGYYILIKKKVTANGEFFFTVFVKR
jgi:hypothetical protein